MEVPMHQAVLRNVEQQVIHHRRLVVRVAVSPKEHALPMEVMLKPAIFQHVFTDDRKSDGGITFVADATTTALPQFGLDTVFVVMLFCGPNVETAGKKLLLSELVGFYTFKMTTAIGPIGDDAISTEGSASGVVNTRYIQHVTYHAQTDDEGNPIAPICEQSGPLFTPLALVVLYSIAFKLEQTSIGAEVMTHIMITLAPDQVLPSAMRTRRATVHIEPADQTPATITSPEFTGTYAAPKGHQVTTSSSAGSIGSRGSIDSGQSVRSASSDEAISNLDPKIQKGLYQDILNALAQVNIKHGGNAIQADPAIKNTTRYLRRRLDALDVTGSPATETRKPSGRRRASSGGKAFSPTYTEEEMQAIFVNLNIADVPPKPLKRSLKKEPSK